MTKKDSVRMEITCCEQCQHCDKSAYYTADSWERPIAWNCKHPAFKRLKPNHHTDHHPFRYPPGITIQDTFDPKPGIPEWCPLRKKKAKKKAKK